MYRRERIQSSVVGVCVTLLAVFTLVLADNVSVSLPPVNVHGPKPHVLFNAGYTERLPCRAEGNPPPVYEWYKNGELLEWGRDYQTEPHDNGTAIIVTATLLTEGYYQCKASNGYGIALSNVTFLQEAVLESVGDIQSVRDVTVSEGDAVTLPCNHTISIPQAYFTWYSMEHGARALGDIVEETDRINIDEAGNLMFSHVKVTDGNKQYKCEVHNKWKRKTQWGSNTLLTVTENVHAGNNMVPKLIYSSNSPLYVNQGDNLTLACFFSGRPTPTVTWNKSSLDRRTRRAATGSHLSTRYTLNKIQVEDAGYYACQGHNAAGQSQKQRLHVIVQEMPTFTAKPSNVVASVGSTVEFRCTARANPYPSVKWIINDVPLEDLDADFDQWELSDDHTTIVKRYVQLRDRATIHCNASNSLGYTMASAYLAVDPNFVEAEEPNTPGSYGGKPTPKPPVEKTDDEDSGSNMAITVVIPLMLAAILIVVIVSAIFVVCRRKRRREYDMEETSVSLNAVSYKVEREHQPRQRRDSTDSGYMDNGELTERILRQNTDNAAHEEELPVSVV